MVYKLEKSSIYMSLNVNYSESCPKYPVEFKIVYLYFVSFGWLWNQKFNTRMRQIYYSLSIEKSHGIETISLANKMAFPF